MAELAVAKRRGGAGSCRNLKLLPDCIFYDAISRSEGFFFKRVSILSITHVPYA